MIKLYGAPWCQDCKHKKNVLAQLGTPYEWVDIEKDTEAQDFVARVTGGKIRLPVLQFADEIWMVEPSDDELAEKLHKKLDPLRVYDALVVGGGPAGLTAALYLTREGADTIIFEKMALGGQAFTTETIENYPGFPAGVGGPELSSAMADQAKRFGTHFALSQEALKLEMEGSSFLVTTDDGKKYQGRALLLATGASYKHLGIPGESDFIGRGVSFCSSCDGPFFKKQDIAVIGGGNSAVEEGLFLTKFADKVTLVVRKDHLRATHILQEKLRSHPRIEVLYNTTPVEFLGDKSLQGLRVRDDRTGNVRDLKVGGVFVFIGLVPNSSFLKGYVDLDEWGYVKTDKTLMTSTPGIFAAGDVRQGSTKQVASAVGEGAAVALTMREYLKEH